MEHAVNPHRSHHSQIVQRNIDQPFRSHHQDVNLSTLQMNQISKAHIQAKHAQNELALPQTTSALAEAINHIQSTTKTTNMKNQRQITQTNHSQTTGRVHQPTHVQATNRKKLKIKRTNLA